MTKGDICRFAFALATFFALFGGVASVNWRGIA